MHSGNSPFANYLSLVMIKHLELSFLKHKRVPPDKQTWFRLTEHIIDSDVTLLNTCRLPELQDYLRARGVTVSGYNKHTLREIAIAVKQLDLPVDPDFRRDCV